MYDGFNYHSEPGPGGDTPCTSTALPVHVTFDLKGIFFRVGTQKLSSRACTIAPAVILVSLHSGCPLQLHRHVPALRPVRRRARSFLCTVVLVKNRSPGEHC